MAAGSVSNQNITEHTTKKNHPICTLHNAQRRFSTALNAARRCYSYTKRNKDVKFNFRTPEPCFLSPSKPGEADRVRKAGRKESPVPGAPIA